MRCFSVQCWEDSRLISGTARRQLSDIHYMHVDPAGRTIKQVLIFGISDCHAACTRGFPKTETLWSSVNNGNGSGWQRGLVAIGSELLQRPSWVRADAENDVNVSR